MGERLTFAAKFALSVLCRVIVSRCNWLSLIQIKNKKYIRIVNFFFKNKPKHPVLTEMRKDLRKRPDDNPEFN